MRDCCSEKSLSQREHPSKAAACTQGDATPSPKEGDPTTPQAAGKERQPVVYPEGMHWQGPEPHLPASVLQRASVCPPEDCRRPGVC